MTGTDYTVEWTVELSAISPADAADKALQMQRDPDSLATVFTVIDPDGIRTAIDVSSDTLDEVAR